MKEGGDTTLDLDIDKALDELEPINSGVKKMEAIRSAP